MRNKLCVIYNSAPHYREGIFSLIDKEYECTWYFGPDYGGIKRLNTSKLHDVHSVCEITYGDSLYWQKDVQKLLKEFDNFLVLGDLRCLSTWLLLCRKKVFFRKKKIYLWSHGWYGKESTITRKIKGVFFRLCDGVFLYGNYARLLMIENGFNPDKLFTIHNSLNYRQHKSLRENLEKTDIYLNHFQNNNHNLVFIGRLTSVKRVDLLLDAMYKLKQTGYFYNLTLIGDGIEKKKLENKCQELGLSSNVWFWGECHDEMINSTLLCNADLCVAPGNVGLTAIHAMSYGCPVATHNNFALQMPEFEAIQDGKTGFFFNYLDSDSIAVSINKWFAQDNYNRKMIKDACIAEIENQWTPEFQLEVIKKYFVFSNANSERN